MTTTSTVTAPTQLPLLPLRDVVVFPHMVIPLFVGRPKSIKALEAAMEQGKSIMLAAQKAAAKDEPSAEHIYEIGCIANILQMLKLPDGTVKVLVEGAQRARIQKITELDSHFTAELTPVESEPGDEAEVEAMRRAIVQQFDQYVKLNKKIPPEILTSLAGIDDAGRLDAVAAQRSQEGERVPTAVRHLGHQPRPPGAAAMKARHIGLRPGLVDEDQAPGINAALVFLPLCPPPRHVRAILLGGVQAFF